MAESRLDETIWRGPIVSPVYHRLMAAWEADAVLENIDERLAGRWRVTGGGATVGDDGNLIAIIELAPVAEITSDEA